MSSLAELWEALRSSGFESLAPALVQHGVLSVNQVALRFSDLTAAGFKSWQLESVLSATHQLAGDAPAPSRARRDLRALVVGRRASFMVALHAAELNSRQESLQTLDNDMLAKSTKPARVRTYMALCGAWEVTALVPGHYQRPQLRCIAQGRAVQELGSLLSVGTSNGRCGPPAIVKLSVQN